MNSLGSVRYHSQSGNCPAGHPAEILSQHTVSPVRVEANNIADESRKSRKENARPADHGGPSKLFKATQ
jgi:hypothetical protein